MSERGAAPVPAAEQSSTSGRWPEHALAAVLALALLAPVLRPGYMLSYDMVATPRVPFTAATLGWGDGLPRAVPQDAVLAVLTTVVPGWLVQLVALVAVVWLAVVGAARLVPTARSLTRLVAGAAYGWNAFVAERLVIGHWGLLLGYAALPWLVKAALAARTGRSPAPVVGWAALAALTPTGGLLAAVTAAVLLCWPAGKDQELATDVGSPARHRRRLRLWAVAVAALNGPWVIAGAVAVSASDSAVAGVDTFAARAENWSGAIGALLGLGGVWNADVVPASRGTVLAPLLTLLLLVVAALGPGPLGRRWGRRPALALAAVAAGALIVAAAGALPGGARLLSALVEWVPGAGLLRDGQKFLPPYALLLAVCFALGIERLADRLAAGAAPGSRAVATGLTLAALCYPVAVLPDLAWGSAGRLASVQYPDDWNEIAADLADRPGGELVTLPFSAFRAYSWNGGRTALDPAQRYFPVDVVVEDALPVGPVLVAGESRRATAVRTALQEGRSLAEIGIRWIVVERETPGDIPPTALAGFRPVRSGRDLILYESVTNRASESVRLAKASPIRIAAVSAGYVISVGILLFAAIFATGHDGSGIRVLRSLAGRRRRPGKVSGSGPGTRRPRGGTDPPDQLG